MNGFVYLLDGFGLIFKPGVRRFVIIPILINIVFFIALFFLASHYMGKLNTWVMGFLPDWLQFLSYLIWFLFFISFFIIFVYAFIAIANIIAAPFNSFLAEKVELYLTGTVPESRSLMETIREIPHMLGRQLSVFGYYIPRALVLFLIFFIPVIHFIAPLLWLFFNSWFLCMLYLDYPSDNHRVSLAEVRDWMGTKRLQVLTFGMSILFTSLIPFLNFFTIPAAVAGATKFWIEERSVRDLRRVR